MKAKPASQPASQPGPAILSRGLPAALTISPHLNPITPKAIFKMVCSAADMLSIPFRVRHQLTWQPCLSRCSLRKSRSAPRSSLPRLPSRTGTYPIPHSLVLPVRSGMLKSNRIESNRIQTYPPVVQDEVGLQDPVQRQAPPLAPHQAQHLNTDTHPTYLSVSRACPSHHIHLYNSGSTTQKSNP